MCSIYCMVCREHMFHLPYGLHRPSVQFTVWSVGNICSIYPMVCIAHVFNLPGLVDVRLYVRCDCLIYTAASCIQ